MTLRYPDEGNMFRGALKRKDRFDNGGYASDFDMENANTLHLERASPDRLKVDRGISWFDGPSPGQWGCAVPVCRKVLEAEAFVATIDG